MMQNLWEYENLMTGPKDLVRINPAVCGWWQSNTTTRANLINNEYNWQWEEIKSNV